MTMNTVDSRIRIVESHINRLRTLRDALETYDCPSLLTDVRAELLEYELQLDALRHAQEHRVDTSVLQHSSADVSLGQHALILSQDPNDTTVQEVIVTVVGDDETPHIDSGSVGYVPANSNISPYEGGFNGTVTLHSILALLPKHTQLRAPRDNSA